MGLEAANYISDLVDTNPTGSDPASSSDDHHRLIKKVLKQTFPNITGPMTATQVMLNGAKVAQGAGPGQLSNAISLGWDGTEIRVSLDGVNRGGLAYDWTVLEASPPGLLGMFFQNSPPAGWLKANGAAVSRTTYSRLFARIGTLYGAGDGSTTFNLPEMRAMFARAWDDARGVDPGRGIGSYQPQGNMAHNHGGATGLNGAHTPSGTANVAGSHFHTGTALAAGSHTNTVPQTRVAGGGGAAASLKSEDSAGSPLVTNSVGDHTHTLSMTTAPDHTHILSMNAVPDHAHSIATDGTESRPFNVALMACIKY